MSVSKIMMIVEGQGDSLAVPLLIRRWLNEEKQRFDVTSGQSFTTKGGIKLKQDFERYLQLAQNEDNCTGILVLLDEEDSCAVTVAQSLAERALKVDPVVPTVIVCCIREYEAWFLASLGTIAGAVIKGEVLIPAGTTFSGDVESKRDVKGWLKSHFPKGLTYKETIHQVAFTEKMDFSIVRQKSRSFRRFENALEQLIQAIDNASVVVTPERPDSTK